MKEFYEVLKGNEIKIPCIFRKKFLQTWKPVAERYNNVVKNWEEQKKLWEVKRQYILKNWGKRIPQLPDLRIEFRNPKEAIQKIAEYECVHVIKFLDMMEQTYREKWLSKIIEQAPEGCNKILVYMTISSEKKEMLLDHNGNIRMNGFMIMATAFGPKNPPSTEEWLMTPQNATVEYVK